jgi:hypothetical protein
MRSAAAFSFGVSEVWKTDRRSGRFQAVNPHGNVSSKMPARTCRFSEVLPLQQLPPVAAEARVRSIDQC